MSQHQRSPFNLLLIVSLVISMSIGTLILINTRPLSAISQTDELMVSATESSRVHHISTNEAMYPDSKIPLYEKFEITFQVNTNAQYLHLPYTDSVIPGLTPKLGISVDAEFTRDNWATYVRVPAFYYQGFENNFNEPARARDWYMATNQYSWKVRFAPMEKGPWQFRLSVQDKDGIAQSDTQSFQVGDPLPGEHGMLQVSQDPRYFEFSDKTYFPGLGYNMNYNHLSWENPVKDNVANFAAMKTNHIQLIRNWPSQWGIYASSWGAWVFPGRAGDPIPFAGLSFDEAYPGSELSMKVTVSDKAWDQPWGWKWDVPCMLLGQTKERPDATGGQNYLIEIRYKTVNMNGPRVSGKLYGFVVKTPKAAEWLWENGQYCHNADVGKVVSEYQQANSTGWQTLTGTFRTNEWMLPPIYLVMENVNTGTSYVDFVSIRQQLPDGNLGPNLVSKASMNQHMYMDQRYSYAFDQIVSAAEKNDVHLKLVLNEKDEWIFDHMDFQGNWIPDGGNASGQRPGDQWFFGNWRAMTKVRWLQQAWWRYAQARWGYSTAIHSWELINEANPYHGLHWTLADEFGKYMHCTVFGQPVAEGDAQKCTYKHPNAHMVTTSTWHSFPRSEFWESPTFPNTDYADIHQYVPELSTASPTNCGPYCNPDPNFWDSAKATYDISVRYGARWPGIATKPLVRGETGFTVRDSGPANAKILNDTTGIWLHNLVWGGVNYGGMIESYWYENEHIYTTQRDLRPIFKSFYQFIYDTQLNTGNYVDAGAETGTGALLAWGQKDMVNGRAHLWIRNTAYTWANIAISKTMPTPVSATVTITGMKPNRYFTIQRWNTWTGTPQAGEPTIYFSTDGSIPIPVQNLTDDLAVKISPAPQPLSTITIVKDAQPDSIQDFVFYGPFGKFILDDAKPDDMDGVPNSITFTVSPGIYNFSEATVPSWYLAGIICEKSATTPISILNRTATITISTHGGERVTCTFVNQRRVNLQAIKFNDLNGDSIYTPNEPTLPGWEMVLYTSQNQRLLGKVTDNNGSTVFNNRIPGTYKLCEAPKVGWSNTLPGAIDASLGRPCYSLILLPGQNASVFFGNTQGAVVRPLEEIDPNNGVTISDLPDINEPEGEEMPEEGESNQNIYLPLIGR